MGPSHQWISEEGESRFNHRSDGPRAAAYEEGKVNVRKHTMKKSETNPKEGKHSVKVATQIQTCGGIVPPVSQDSECCASAPEGARVSLEQVEGPSKSGAVELSQRGSTASSRSVPQADSSIRLADTLDTIVGLIQQYSSLPNPAVAMLMAVWIANTYTYKAFRYVGYLTLRSATPQCGKTRLLRMIGSLSHGAPRPTTSPSAAVLYRSRREVLLLDEVDGLRNKDKETQATIIAVLNAGFEEGGMIERLEKDANGNFVVEEFPVFGPKALAGIEHVTDTLADRAFVIDMYRADQRMPRLNMRLQEETFRGIREQLATWADQHREAVRTRYDQLPAELPELSGLDDRFQDISEPLVVLALKADAERPHGPAILPRLLEGLCAVVRRRTVSSRERGLRVVLDILESRWGVEVENLDTLVPEIFIGSDDLLQECRQADELDWIESTKALAGFLKHFGLSPQPDTRGQKRGYRITREWVQQWRKSYGKEALAA